MASNKTLKSNDASEKCTKTDDALCDSEQKFRNLFDNAAIGMFRTRLDGSEILDVNDAFLHIFERTRSDMTGAPSIFHWADPREREEMVRRLEADGRVTEFECRMLTRSGEVRHCLTSLTLYREQGILEGSIRDISDRKRAEQALARSEWQYRSLFEAITDSVFVVDRETLDIIDVNTATCRLYGYTREELLQMKAVDVSAEPEKTLRVVRNEITAVPLRYHRKKDGTIFPVEISGGYFSDGTHVYHTACIRDISERKRLETEREKLQAELHHAMKMESVGILAGGVAHDFNNMLSVILGHCDIALDGVDPSKPPYRNLSEIQKAAQRSAKLTRQLLAFARKQTISPKTIRLDEIVAGMQAMLQRLIGEEIELRSLKGGGTWMVKMDPSQVEQVLVNLVVNARDAIGGVGKVTIETKAVTVDASSEAASAALPPNEYVLMSVSDDGAGIDAEILDNIFDPFFTTKGPGKGTGLGLSTVYGIVQQNRGFIRVESKRSEGTTIRIYLPRDQDPEEKNLSVEPFPRPTRIRKETVLLVEDDPAVLGITENMLVQLGCRVLAALGPRKALEIVDSYSDEIHLIVTDVIMPEMNGRQLTDEILSRRPNIKHLFISGYTADVLTPRGALDEPVNFIEKPFTREKFARKINEVLNAR